MYVCIYERTNANAKEFTEAKCALLRRTITVQVAEALRILCNRSVVNRQIDSFLAGDKKVREKSIGTKIISFLFFPSFLFLLFFYFFEK